MSKPDATIDPLILKSAKKEFLSKGFEQASLKTICENAGFTTGALYKRYKGKADLFRVLVTDTVAAMEAVVEQRCSADIGSLSDEALTRAWEMNRDDMMWWFGFLHARHDDFVLLLRCAEGTEYSTFQHDWVEKMTETTYGYFLEAQRRTLTEVSVSREELHILLSAFWTTIYEPFIHGYTWEQLEAHCRLVCSLFNWQRVFGFGASP